MTKYILKAEVRYGSDTPHRALLTHEDGAYYIKIEMQCKDGEWHVTPGQWYLSTLVGADKWGGHPGKWVDDKIFIDFGQGWFITGMHDVLEEALNIVLRGVAA